MFANEKYGEAAKALSEWLAIFGPGEIIEKVEYEDGNIAQALSHITGATVSSNGCTINMILILPWPSPFILIVKIRRK